MTTATHPDAVTVTPAVLDRMRDLYARGLCLQAYRAAEPLGPFRLWSGADARVLAGRVAAHLGAPRLCHWLHLRARRAEPDHPEAAYYFGRAVLESRGPLAAWRFLRRQGELAGAPDALRAEWLALHGCVLGRLRDFDAAEAWLDRAQALAPDEPWPWIERAALLELEDRYEESLSASRRVLELRPGYRAGTQCVAHTLQLLGRDREALELLTEAAGRIESTFLLFQLAAVQTELGHHADARRTYDRFAELAVLLEKDSAAWLAARRADSAYFCGDRAAAAELARQVGEPLYQGFAAELGREPFAGRRALLDVGFVRQHHATCVPATLTALARYWGRPVDHRDVAGAICYDGTPDHRERAWAEENGYVCREFTLTWEAAVALIDRGVPFTLTLVEPGSAHMQAVIGYDTCRQSLLARDPTIPHHVEYHAPGLLERYRATGPRGHALVPHDQAYRLDGLTLPDAGLYDRLYRLQRALQRHDRAAAAAECAALGAEAPDHRLTWHARRVLALYDADPAELLACADGLLRLFPGDQLCLLLRLSCLRDQARRDELIGALDAECARRDADPLFRRLRAREALADAREHPRAIRLLRHALRRRPYDEGALATLAQLLWAQRRFGEALELFGFAACLGDKDEGLAREYFIASQHLGRAGQTLALLRRRFERFGARSSQPALTLYWALEAGNRAHEGLAVLDEALALRPEGELLLFAAARRAENGDFDRAAALLARAEGRCPHAGWLRASAALAEARGDAPVALALWRAVVQAEPAALDAARAVAGHLAGLEGRPAALAFLRAACARFPHNYPLQELLSAWLRDEGPVAQEPVVRHIIAIHPGDAWARRELAAVLTEQGRLDEAEAELGQARLLEPESPSYWCVGGALRQRQGRLAEAREAYRAALRLSVDNDWAIARLMQTAETLAERREALTFLEGELRRQVIFGDGLLAFQQYARWTLTPDELLAVLRDGHSARPELWQAWSALIAQLRETGRADEAHALAAQATERFPLVPALWLELALVCEARGDAEGEAAALGKASQVRPGWAAPLRLLGECHLRGGRLAEARPLLERALALAPLDAVGHGSLAGALWQAGEKEAALERVRTALRLDPGHVWAWERLGEWSAELGRPEVPEAQARELAGARPGEARSWLQLAQTLSRPEDTDERLAALDRALALNPQLQDASDLRAVLLASVGRWDEAEAACAPTAWDGTPPLILRGRLAWLKAQRGDVAAAIAGMRAALAEDPDYHWGWTQLADWVRNHGTPQEQREAGDNLVRLAPGRALGYGYRGEGRDRCGDRAGAKEDFRRAFELAPTYNFAGMNLFDMQLADGELDAAAATLAALKAGEDDAYVRAREAMLAARRGDRAGALKALREVATMEAGSDWPVEAAVAALAHAGWAGWQADAAGALGEALAEPGAVPVAARQWVRLCTDAGHWGCARRLDELLTRGPVGAAALDAYVFSLGRHRKRNLLEECVAHHREALRAHPQAWGAVGYAYARLEDYAAVCDWCHDWASRESARPWMLMNLVLSLRYRGRRIEANAVSRHTVTLGRDHCTTFHLVWLAFDEALAGRAVEGLGCLDGIEADGLDPTHRYVRALVAALADVQGAAPWDRRAAFAAARRRLVEAAKACSPLPEDGPVVWVAYRAAVRRLGRDAGGLTGRLWALGRRLRPVLPDLVAG
jgi:tetratricopeptide (TPR) repeat protein